MGQKNESNQYYVQRNAVFETNAGISDPVDYCLAGINCAFKWGKPAIISNHRVCFAGELDDKNKMKGLRDLRSLLNSITKIWPDVEFFNMHDLYKLIEDENIKQG